MNPLTKITKTGLVIGTKMSKTIKVQIEKTRMHPVVQKQVVYHKTLFAHDPAEQCVVGDVVQIKQAKRRSKLKFFELSQIIKPAQRYTDRDGIQHSQGIGRFNQG